MYATSRFLEMTKIEFYNLLKYLTEKMTAVTSLTHVWAMVDHCQPKLKISH